MPIVAVRISIKMLTFACELSVVLAARLVRAHHTHNVLPVLVLQECRLSQKMWHQLVTQSYCKA
jgi:hypothetical protein